MCVDVCGIFLLTFSAVRVLFTERFTGVRHLTFESWRGPMKFKSPTIQCHTIQTLQRLFIEERLADAHGDLQLCEHVAQCPSCSAHYVRLSRIEIALRQSQFPVLRASLPITAPLAAA